MLNVYSKSDIGLVRQSNEDACRAGVLSQTDAWAVVCDGMGGANGGNVASSIAVEKISEQIMEKFSEVVSEDNIREMILNAVIYANRAVHEKAGADIELSGMGTTVVVAVVSNGIAHIAHAGDSRAYLIAEDSIRQLTTDHSMVQEMVDKGDLTAQEARNHPQKNIITRALGVESSIRIDYSTTVFVPGSLLLICTDGLTNYIEEERILCLAKTMGAGELTERLVGMAKEAGGGDNITVAVIEY